MNDGRSEWPRLSIRRSGPDIFIARGPSRRPGCTHGERPRPPGPEPDVPDPLAPEVHRIRDRPRVRLRPPLDLPVLPGPEAADRLRALGRGRVVHVLDPRGGVPADDGRKVHRGPRGPLRAGSNDLLKGGRAEL